MARFRFSLQPVLEHRVTIEREKQRAVAALERERLGLEDAIRVCQQAIKAEHSEARGRLIGTLDVRAVRQQGAAALRHAAAARRAVLRLAGVHQRLASARAELLEAARKRKAVELLRERRYEQWKQDQSRREAGALDELVVMGHGRGDGVREREVRP